VTTDGRPAQYDAIVVGAGHNGLVCATLLAKHGRDVLVLESAEQVGGGAVTREFARGFSVSACARLVSQLHPVVIDAVALRPRYSRQDLATVALGAEGSHVTCRGASVSGVGEHDRDAYAAFHATMSRYAKLVASWQTRIPPRLGGDWRDSAALAGLAVGLRRLGRDDMREFLRVIGMNIHDELDDRFEHPLLKGALALEAVLGTHLGPRSPNTVLTYLHRIANGGRAALPAGGAGMLTADLAGLAASAGVEIRTAQPVERIIVETGRVAGVETAAGDRFESRTVVSNADPKRTIMALVGARHFETGFVRRVVNLRARGNAAKLNVALDALPDVEGLDAADLGARLVLAPDEHYVERAFNPAKYGAPSTQPVAEIVFPSLGDESLAPPGKHVMSAIVQYAPYALDGGWSDAARESFLETTLDAIETVIPGLRSTIVASELLTPVDIEREFSMTGGHWHHGELALDQYLFTRPVASAAQYRMPLDGLWLCGAGTHPGGGISGAPGYNAASAILKREDGN